MRVSRSAVPVPLLFVLAIAGCGGGDDGGGPTAPSGPATITLSPSSADLTYIGHTRGFRATVRDANGQTVDAQVSWSSSDASVFTVDASGTVTAVGNGSAQLEATVGSVSASAAVTVNQVPTTLLVVSGGGQEGTAGSTLPNPIVIQVADQGGTGVAGIIVSFAPGEGAGSVDPQNAATNADGEASTEWTLGGDRLGNQSLRASISQGGATLVSARAVPENPIPDLAIEGSLRLSRQEPTTLETVDVILRVANLGNAATPAVFPLALLVDGTAVETFEVAQLGVGQRVTLTYTVGPFEAGDREIAVALDPDDEIEEWTEENNSASTGATVARQQIIEVSGTGEVWSGEISGDSTDLIHFRLDVAEAMNEVLTVRLEGGAGDADLFMGFYGSRPRDPFDYQCVSLRPATDETCQTVPTRAGSYQIAVHAFSDFGPTTMTVNIGGEPEEPYSINLVFVGSATDAQKEVVENAAEVWESIIAAGVPDLDFSEGPLPAGACGSASPAINDVVDDIRIFVSIDSIDGERGVLGRSTPCHVRVSNFLDRTFSVLTGRFELDEADMERLDDLGLLDETVVHEIAHVLGFGTIWDDHGLLVNPSGVNPVADTHFDGQFAVAAFDAAGGRSYTGGAKVPVQGGGEPGVSDGHWRLSVFGTELMTPFISQSGSALSAITIESFADLGLAVNLDEAESYDLPGSEAAAMARMKGPAIDLSGDILYTPITLVDMKTGVTRVIHRR